MTNKKSTKLRWLSREILTSPYCYALCLDESAFFAELKRADIAERDWPDFISGKANAATHIYSDMPNGSHFIIVTLNTTDITENQLQGLLIHEAVHIWQAICRSIGEHDPSDEMEAYIIQRISQELMYDYLEQTTGAS